MSFTTFLARIFVAVKLELSVSTFNDAQLLVRCNDSLADICLSRRDYLLDLFSQVAIAHGAVSVSRGQYLGTKRAMSITFVHSQISHAHNVSNAKLAALKLLRKVFDLALFEEPNCCSIASIQVITISRVLGPSIHVGSQSLAGSRTAADGDPDLFSNGRTKELPFLIFNLFEKLRDCNKCFHPLGAMSDCLLCISDMCKVVQEDMQYVQSWHCDSSKTGCNTEWFSHWLTRRLRRRRSLGIWARFA